MYRLATNGWFLSRSFVMSDAALAGTRTFIRYPVHGLVLAAYPNVVQLVDRHHRPRKANTFTKSPILICDSIPSFTRTMTKRKKGNQQSPGASKKLRYNEATGSSQRTFLPDLDPANEARSTDGGAASTEALEYLRSVR